MASLRPRPPTDTAAIDLRMPSPKNLSLLTTRSLHKTSPCDRIYSWDLDTQPYPQSMRLYSHYEKCQELSDLSQQIFSWIEREESSENRLTKQKKFTTKTESTQVKKEDLLIRKLPSRHANQDPEIKLKFEINNMIMLIEAHPDHIRFHGRLGALIKLLRRHPFKEKPLILRSLSSIIESNQTLKKENESLLRRERKSHRSRVDFVNGILRDYESIQVVHLVLASTEKKSWSEEDHTKLLMQRNKLIKNVKNKTIGVFTGTIGYLWRCFYQPFHGPKLCLSLILDPQLCDEDPDHIATEVAKHWLVDITGPNGTALTQSLVRKARDRDRDRNDRKNDDWKGSQVGLVCRSRREDIIRLQTFLNYMTTLDHFCSFYPSNQEGKQRRQRSQDQGDGPWRRKVDYVEIPE